LWDVFDYYRVEILGDVDVVTCAKSSIAEFIKAREENPSTGFLERNVSAEMSEGFWPDCIVFLTAQHFEDCIDLTRSIWIRFPESE
jgi:hypothetical protein